MKIFYLYFKIALLGAGSFWLPDIFIHALTGKDFGGIRVLLITVLLPLSTLIVFRVLCRYNRKLHPLKLALFMLLGIWMLGPLSIVVEASFSMGELLITDWWMVLKANAFFPLTTWVMSAYDGSMGALILVTLGLLIGASMQNGNKKI